jgi:hypothetical protein
MQVSLDLVNYIKESQFISETLSDILLLVG